MVRNLFLSSLFALCLAGASCTYIQELEQKHLQPPPPPSPTVSAPVGPRVYVTDKNSRVLAVKTADNKIAEQYPVELGAGYVAVSPDNLTLYATARAKDYLRIFQTTGAPLGRIATGKEPVGLELTRDGKTAFVANKGDNTISVLDLKTRKSVKTIPTGQEPLIVALSPNNKRLYVLAHKDNEVIAYDAHTHAEIGRAKIGVDGYGLAVDPGGKYVYASSFGTNEVIVLDAANLTEVAHVKVGDGPYEVLATRDGTIYVGCVEDNSVVAFKRDVWDDVKATPVGARPYGLALSPDEHQLYVALEGDARVSVRALPTLDEKAKLDIGNGLVPIDVFTGPQTH